MQRVSAEPAVVASMIVAAVAVWWLSTLALLPETAIGVAAAVSVQATGIVVMAQWLMIALLTPLWLARHDAGNPLLIAGSACLPLWPLLMMLWAATGIPTLTLVGTQLGAFAVFTAAMFACHALRRLPVADDTARTFGIAAGAGLAAILWIARYPLLDLVRPS